jgi:hypothetical protein
MSSSLLDPTLESKLPPAPLVVSLLESMAEKILRLGKGDVNGIKEIVLKTAEDIASGNCLAEMVMGNELLRRNFECEACKRIIRGSALSCIKG